MSDTLELDSAEFDAAESGAVESGTAESGTAESGTAESGTAESDTAESDTAESDATEFDRYYNGLLYSVMRWDQLTAFWDRIDAGAGWYLYAVGQDVPDAPAAAGKVRQFTRELDELLRREHHEDYCAIVYADNLETPNFIKIYDPGQLGSSCGSGATQSSVVPGWMMSKMPPRELSMRGIVTGQRTRWWQSLMQQPA